MDNFACIGFLLAVLAVMFHENISEWFNKPSQAQLDAHDRDMEDFAREERARDNRHAKFYQQIFRKHINKLLEKRMNLVSSDDYGAEDLRAFNKELEYFVDNVVSPEHKKWVEKLDGMERYQISDDALEQKPKWKKVTVQMLAEYVNDYWEEDSVQKQVQEIKASSEPMPSDPYEFERWVARLMEKDGWTARATSGSGDQGADVIAEKDGWKVIIQCKMYKKSVGNKAVQEAHAAKTHFNGTHAIVVNSSGQFTKSARELAATSGVKLMHPNNLRGWEPDF